MRTLSRYSLMPGVLEVILPVDHQVCGRSTFDIEKPRRHRIAPYGIFFWPEGHGYLNATLLEVIPAGNETIHSAIDYRLDRIASGTVLLLPRMLPPARPQPKSYTL